MDHLDLLLIFCRHSANLKNSIFKVEDFGTFEFLTYQCTVTVKLFVKLFSLQTSINTEIL